MSFTVGPGYIAFDRDEVMLTEFAAPSSSAPSLSVAPNLYFLRALILGLPITATSILCQATKAQMQMLEVRWPKRGFNLYTNRLSPWKVIETNKSLRIEPARLADAVLPVKSLETEWAKRYMETQEFVWATVFDGLGRYCEK